MSKLLLVHKVFCSPVLPVAVVRGVGLLDVVALGEDVAVHVDELIVRVLGEPAGLLLDRLLHQTDAHGDQGQSWKIKEFYFV